MSDDGWGERPVLQWMEVGGLSIDHTYQRTLETRASQKLVERIAAEFRWPRFGAILVTRSGLVLDGQHRLAAVRRLGIAEVPCIVVEAATVADQAQSFLHANRDRVAVTALAMHRASVAAGEGEAVEIERVVVGAGFVVPGRQALPAHRKPEELTCLRVVGRMIKEIGAEETQAALGALRAAWPDALVSDTWMVQGVCRLVRMRRGSRGLRVALARVTHKSVVDAVRRRYAASGQARWMAARDVLGAIVDRKTLEPATRPSLLGKIDAARLSAR